MEGLLFLAHFTTNDNLTKSMPENVLLLRRWDFWILNIEPLFLVNIIFKILVKVCEQNFFCDINSFNAKNDATALCLTLKVTYS